MLKGCAFIYCIIYDSSLIISSYTSKSQGNVIYLLPRNKHLGVPLMDNAYNIPYAVIPKYMDSLPENGLGSAAQHCSLIKSLLFKHLICR